MFTRLHSLGAVPYAFMHVTNWKPAQAKAPGQANRPFSQSKAVCQSAMCEYPGGGSLPGTL